MDAHLELHRCRGGNFFTDNRFWDCECEQHYIHAKASRRFCSVCRSYAEDQPDSRFGEITKGLDFATVLDKVIAHKMDEYDFPELDYGKRDMTLGEGVAVLENAGMKVLVAEKPEDIDNWPTLDELFPDLLEDDDGT